MNDLNHIHDTGLAAHASDRRLTAIQFQQLAEVPAAVKTLPPTRSNTEQILP